MAADKRAHTRQQLDFLFADGDVFEVCLLGIKEPRHKLWGGEFAGGKPVSGYFNDKDKAVEAIRIADEQVKPVGVYLTANPCKPELLARANNRLMPTKVRTSDSDIARIENFFIDLDPKRATGISASQEEMAFAEELAYRVLQDLIGFGRMMFALSDTNQTNYLLRGYPDAYLFGALLESAPFIRDDGRLAMWQERFDRAVDEIQIQEDKSKGIVTLGVDAGAQSRYGTFNIWEG